MQDSKAPVWSLPDMNFSPYHHSSITGQVNWFLSSCLIVNMSTQKSFALEASADADNAPVS